MAVQLLKLALTQVPALLMEQPVPILLLLSLTAEKFGKKEILIQLNGCLTQISGPSARPRLALRSSRSERRREYGAAPQAGQTAQGGAQLVGGSRPNPSSLPDVWRLSADQNACCRA